MIDINKKYRTKDGEEVRIYATDGAGSYPVHGAVKTAGGWYYVVWTNVGSLFKAGRDPADLVEVVMLPEYWVLFFENYPPRITTVSPTSGNPIHITHHPTQEKPVT